MTNFFLNQIKIYSTLNVIFFCPLFFQSSPPIFLKFLPPFLSFFSILSFDAWCAMVWCLGVRVHTSSLFHDEKFRRFLKLGLTPNFQKNCMGFRIDFGKFGVFPPQAATPASVQRRKLSEAPRSRRPTPRQYDQSSCGWRS